MPTLPVPNQQSPIAEIRKGLGGKLQAFLIPPWNSWFQQFSQKPAAVASITIGASPFSYTANVIGQIIVRGGTVSSINLIRGDPATPANNIDMTGALSIFVSLGDTVVITYTVPPTIRFLAQ